MGFTPPDVDAVHVIFVGVGEPTHVAVSADAAPTNANATSVPAVAIDTNVFRNIFFIFYPPLTNNTG